MTSSFAQSQPLWQPVNIQSDTRRRKRTIKTKVKIGPATLVFALVILIALLSIGILARANRNTVSGYEIERLLKDITALNIDNEVLSKQIAEAQSLKDVRDAAVVKGMERTINYRTVVMNKNSSPVAWAE
ncbi:MAG: hypothetical protein PHU71_05905 [Candidatus Gracilibacteria bacterium]|nr:hypothetical protein [Candidatus Gracilibacteria bacterium]